MVRNITAFGEHAGFLFHALEAVLFIVLKSFQILVIFKVAGLLDHESAVLCGSVSTGSKLELIQILCQTADLGGVFRFGHFHDSAQLFLCLHRELAYRQCQVVEFVDIFLSEVQRSIHLIGEHTFRKSEAHIRRI